MPLQEIILLLAIGAIAGVMGGMFGLGGGAIIVPALMFFLDFSQTEANGTSLVALVLPVGIFAVLTYYRQGKLKLKPAGAVAFGLLLGTGLGANIALGLPKQLLSVSYGLFLAYMGWKYASPRQWYAETQGATLPPVPEDTAINVNAPSVLAWSVAIGALAGVLGGMFGIGGGTVIVTALVAMGFDQKLATGTSLGALLLPVGLPAVLNYYNAGALDIAVALPIIFTLTLFQIVGARVSLGLSAKTVKRLFGLFLLVISLRYLLGA